jgi:glycosyltransferase involved in cell wall biosynthesis
MAEMNFESTTIMDRSPVAFVGTYSPRRCGIATFTHDLCEAVAGQCGEQKAVFSVAINDRPEGYDYPPRVHFELRQNAQADYRLAAEYLNMNQVSAVCLQHEYGIFGGTCGSHSLSLLRRLRRPLVCTLHTVLKEPTSQQKLLLQETARLADRLVVMADLARDFLREVYDVPEEKIAVIPHGIPDVPFVDPHFFKDQFGVEGRRVLLTFGLLSPGKGLEVAIEALPEIVKQHPDVVYIVLGATHPHVKATSGEEYRNSLQRRVNELGMREHVIFVNRFVEMQELCEYLGATDMYLTPYLNEAQITSGTLAYAMGTGKAVVSTPYWHAKEMLADDRGRLVGFGDSEAITQAVNDLLGNEADLNALRKRAYTHCRKMTWQRVAQDYLDLFDVATEAWVQRRQAGKIRPRRLETFDLPELDLRHLRRMTDDVGIFQHCIYATPNRDHGYCTDDNTRAIIAAAQHWELNHDDSILPLMETYLGFLAHALDEGTGRFRNFMDYARTWMEPVGSEDSHGRAMWGLGHAVSASPHPAMTTLASRLFLAALPVTERFTSPRAWAFTLCGLHGYLRRFGGDSEVRRHRAQLAERLLKQFLDHRDNDWPWCEDALSYANPKLPHVLMMSGMWMQRGDMIDVGREALTWLIELQTSEDGCFSPIGSNGWYRRGGQRARFDQQPVEAHAMVDACIEAYHVTREEEWARHAQKAFYWFLGENDLRTALVDFTTGGCRDGLHPDRVNENQGAESTLAWLMSLLLMQDIQMELSLAEIPGERNGAVPKGSNESDEPDEPQE